MQGRVRMFKEAAGFGFISVKAQKEVYFHASNWFNDTVPTVGDRVIFDLGPSNKPGMPDQAINIQKVEPVIDAASLLGGPAVQSE